MSKQVLPESALLMLHWQNSFCNSVGQRGRNTSVTPEIIALPSA